MTKFRNVRVKMKCGKTRIQRAMVLASGKWRFVKNVKRSSSSSRASSPRHQTRGTSNMRKGKSHGSRGGSLLRSVEKLTKSVALASPLITTYYDPNPNKGIMLLKHMTGYDAGTRQWHWDNLKPYATIVGVSFLGWAAAHKIHGLIRRM